MPCTNKANRRAWIGCTVIMITGVLAGCGNDARIAEGHTACSAVMHIGDSLTVGMTSEGQISDSAERLDSQYRAVGVTDVRVDGGVGRTIHEMSNDQQPGAEVARQARASGFRGCWVIDLLLGKT